MTENPDAVKIARLLAQLVSDTHADRRAAALAFREMGVAAVEPLRELLKQGDRRAKLEAVRTLGDVGDRAAGDDLLEALCNADPHLAARSARALGRLKQGRAAFPLIAAFSHPSPDVRYEAALALTRLPVMPLRGYLEAHLQSEAGITSWGVPVVEAFRQALDQLPLDPEPA